MRWAAAVALGCTLAACSSIPRVPAKGEVFGQRVSTTVDSGIARDYLEGRHDPRIEEIQRRHEGALPSREELLAISREASVDFAALFLARRLLAETCNRELNRRFGDYLGRPSERPIDPSPYRVLFVPGWDHVEMGAVTGADFARPRAIARAFGIEHDFVAIPGRGVVEGNAAIVAAAIRRHASSGRRLILAGASSAGPAIHLALDAVAGTAEGRSVAAWLNIGGILHGSPIVDYLNTGPRRPFFEVGLWWTGWDREAILSLGTTARRPAAARARIDPHVVVVNYLAVPLSGHVGRHARDNYPVLARQGPNDGLTLLSDVLLPGSLTVVALGSDHFIADDPDIDAKTLALVKLMVHAIERPCAAR